MKPADALVHVRSLKGNIAVLLLSVAVSAAAIHAVIDQRTAWQARRDLAVMQHAEQRARIEQARTEEQELRQQADLYREIVERGLVQPERRLDWIERLNRIKAQRRLLDLHYELSPQRPLETEPTATSSPDFRASRMTIDMPLLHENDLLGLLSDLAAQPGVIVSPRHCVIERLPPASPATLKAWCELDWITVREDT